MPLTDQGKKHAIRQAANTVTMPGLVYSLVRVIIQSATTIRAVLHARLEVYQQAWAVWLVPSVSILLILIIEATYPVFFMAGTQLIRIRTIFIPQSGPQLSFNDGNEQSPFESYT